MEPDALLLFGNVAVKHYYLHRYELEECLGIQQMMYLIGGAKPLGDIIRDSGYLDREHVSYILKRQEMTLPDDPALSRFGNLALVNGLVTRDEIKTALKLQRRYEKRRGMRLHLGEMLLVQGSLSLFERDAVLKAQQRLRGGGEIETPRPPTDREELLLELRRMDRTGIFHRVLLVVLLLMAATAAVIAIVASGGL